MLDKFGRTLMFLLFLMFFLMGAHMALIALDPYTRKISASLADTIQKAA